MSEVAFLSLFAKLLELGSPKYLWNCAEALSMITLMKFQFSISNPQIPWFHFWSWLFIKNSSSFYIYCILCNSVKIVLLGNVCVEQVYENKWQIRFKVTMGFSFSHKYIVKNNSPGIFPCKVLLIVKKKSLRSVCSLSEKNSEKAFW